VRQRRTAQGRGTNPRLLSGHHAAPTGHSGGPGPDRTTDQIQGTKPVTTRVSPAGPEPPSNRIPVRTSCTGSRRPRGAARAAGPGRPGRTPAAAPARLASSAGRLARKAQAGAAETRGSHRAAAHLTREPSRRPSSGKRGQARSQPDPRTSVRAAAPCQIRRSVCADLTNYQPLPASTESASAVKGLLTAEADS
jgi:hypothetical protein